MKKLVQVLGCFLVLPVLLAGCGGGGGGGDSTTTPAGALSTAGAGASLTQAVDGGTTVTANFTNAVDINDANEVIGFAEITPGADISAALWKVDIDANDGAVITPRELDPIAGTFSAAFALDEAGTAVGQSSTATSALVAVFWAPAASTPTALPPLAGGNSKALDISADGTLIVGEAADATGAIRAVVWAAEANGDFVAAPTVLPVNIFASGADLSTFASASGVARGPANEILIAGEAEAGDLRMHAALWRSTNGGTSYIPIDLGADRIAYAVNSAGLVTGETDDTLAPLSWQVTAGVAAAPVSLAAAGSAVAVNENGRIAGWTGTTPVAAVWNGTVPASVFSVESQAFGLNNAVQPLVVGRKGTAAFIKRVN